MIFYPTYEVFAEDICMEMFSLLNCKEIKFDPVVYVLRQVIMVPGGVPL